MAKIVFKTTKRNKKIALWVVNGGQEQNIWDIEKQACTPAVLRAIQSAYELGVRQALAEAKSQINRMEIFCDRDWEEGNGDK